MATSFAAPTETAVDLGSTIDDVFSEASSPEDTGQVETQQAAPDTQETAIPEATQETVAEPEVKTIDGYQLDQAGNYIVPKTELPQLQSAKQYADAVMQKFPTPQDAEIAYAQSSDFMALLNDFQYGDDAQVDQVLNFLSGGAATDPALKASMQQGFERMAQRSAGMLAKLNPEAHSKHVGSLIQNNIDSLYQKWQQSGNEQDKLAYQRASWGHTGQYKTEAQRIDPAQQQQEQLAAQQKQFEAQQGQALQRDWGSYNKSTVDGPKWDQYNAEIDKVLGTVKAAHDPAVYNAIRKEIAATVLDKMQQDFEFVRTQNIARTQIEKGYERAWKARQPAEALNPRIQSYQANFMARVRQILPSVAKPLIDKAAAPKAAVRTAPQAPPQQPNRAANGQYQPNQKQGLSNDQEWSNIFS